MPLRHDPPTGAPCWIELFTHDSDRAESFYGELFGWVAENAGEDYGGYINFSKDGHLVAGCMRNDGSAGTSDGWTVYLHTPDLATAAELAPAHGAQVAVPPTKVMDLGSMAGFIDPGGAYIGAWQPGTHLGIELLAEPGAPAWFELHTSRFDESVDFYRAVFAWDTHVASDTPEFRYTTYGEGDGQLAGIMDSSQFPGGPPAGWSIYFGVDNTDESLARAVEIGGTVVHPAEDTPYGRIAALTDPMGTAIKLVQGTD